MRNESVGEAHPIFFVQPSSRLNIRPSPACPDVALTVQLPSLIFKLAHSKRKLQLSVLPSKALPDIPEAQVLATMIQQRIQPKAYGDHLTFMIKTITFLDHFL